jgi:transcriptional regulator with PAS, ATPase and Fis domain
MNLIGNSPAMLALKDQVARIAPFDAKVLITGETGAGKELAAKAIHAVSRRAHRPFVAVNCAGLPESLLESELFGHVRGSFTGAYRDKQGKFELAHGGTMFLDEVGEMTMRMQSLMLRVLQLGEVQKVGSDSIVRRVDVRIIAATNRDLLDLVRQGLFREDLYYRLNVIRISVPPLREKRQDLPALLTHFLDRFADAAGSVPPTVEPAAMHALMAYSWPGNVRELANIAERLIAAGRPSVVLEDLPEEIRLAGASTPAITTERRRTVADDLLERLLSNKESFWNSVYPLFMEREISRDTVRQVVRSGLQTARGNYKIVSRIFNMQAGDYKRFLDFLRKHDCQVSFKEYR